VEGMTNDELCRRVVPELIRSPHSFYTLASFNDDDLERIATFERGGDRHEHSLRILDHLIDHESQHNGQIVMLKSLLGSQS